MLTQELVPFEAISVEHITQQQLDEILLQNAQMKENFKVFKADIEVVKNAAMALSEKIGIKIVDGKADFNLLKVTGIITDIALMSEKKRAKEFSFMGDAIDVISKYKNI